MSYKYRIKEGEENRVFINVIKHKDGTIESEEELFSPYLELISDNDTVQEPQQPASPEATQQISVVALDDEPKQETN